MSHHHHEIVKGNLFTGRLFFLMLLMAAGAAAFLARFAFGLGATTHLSDNYPWGLWIVFDLIWIALAGGAFATAGLVYVFMADRYHPLVRPAVWMGFLSYSFVVVTLVADLGRPWNFYQLALQRPDHSAMYEVSWCVTLYVTVLALEFAPTVFERFGWTRLHDLWRTWSPVYTVIALGLFLFLMSHSVAMAIAGLVLFSIIVLLTRKSYERSGVPLILVIAAVTFSTMHQSSLGSLFLLMPDKLSPLWWSPVMPVLFFSSAVVSGFALVMVTEMLISFFFKRPYKWAMLAGMGRILFFCLAVYMVMRIADIVHRGQLGAVLAGSGLEVPRDRTLFLVEVIAGGIVPLVLLSLKSLRRNHALLVCSTLLAMGGVMFNRLNVVLLGMHLPGTQPGGVVGTYYPSLVEWTLSISLIAAAIFFFATGVKLLPIVPKHDESAQEA